jgi:hypothetical protein
LSLSVLLPSRSLSPYAGWVAPFVEIPTRLRNFLPTSSGGNSYSSRVRIAGRRSCSRPSWCWCIATAVVLAERPEGQHGLQSHPLCSHELIPEHHKRLVKIVFFGITHQMYCMLPSRTKSRMMWLIQLSVDNFLRGQGISPAAAHCVSTHRGFVWLEIQYVRAMRVVL